MFDTKDCRKGLMKSPGPWQSPEPCQGLAYNMTGLPYNTDNMRLWLGGLFLLAGFLLFQGCEKPLPLSHFETDYQPEYRIEGDFFPTHLGKSVLRIDRTFGLREEMSIDRSQVRDARAELRTADGVLLSTLSWQDSAKTYPFYWQTLYPEKGTPRQISDHLISDGHNVDYFNYGAYKLDNLQFRLSPDQVYQLQVTIAGEEYVTSFTPHPQVRLQHVSPDSTVLRKTADGWTYQVTQLRLEQPTIRLEWEEQPNGYYYTVHLNQLPAVYVPRILATPEPRFSYSADKPRYEIIIGSMNRTLYQHYYLTDFPVNHELRNFFHGKALGYAGTLTERYLEVMINDN